MRSSVCFSVRVLITLQDFFESRMLISCSNCSRIVFLNAIRISILRTPRTIEQGRTVSQMVGGGAPLAITGLSNLSKAWLFLDFKTFLLKKGTLFKLDFKTFEKIIKIQKFIKILHVQVN